MKKYLAQTNFHGKNDMKKLLALLAFIPSIAFADAIPFFKSPGVLDQSKWYIASGWQEQNCWWKPAEVSSDDTNLKLMIQSKADFTGTSNDIPKGLYACGQIQSWTRQTYGTYTITMKTASGSGLNTAFFLYDQYGSADEIDFEFLGLHPTQLSLNYWVGGKNQSLAPVSLGYDASQAFHTYTLVWTKTNITWYADGKQLFQTKPGAIQPSHLTRMYLDLWTGMPGWMGAFTYSKPITAEYGSIGYISAIILPSPPVIVVPVPITHGAR